MINGKKIVVVLPAYNAERTLEATVSELPEPHEFAVKLEIGQQGLSRVYSAQFKEEGHQHGEGHSHSHGLS